jgi:hypothetical protein
VTHLVGGITIESPSAFVLALAGLVAAIGGILSTILAAHRARDEERQACEEKLRAIRVEAGALADELYRLKARKDVG